MSGKDVLMPEGDFEILDDQFKRCIKPTAHVDKIAEGSRWAEGGAYFPAGRYYLWSDIPNDRMMRWDETNGVTSVFRQPANNSNGNTVDRQGRLVSCEHGTRRVTRTEHDGSITVIADNYQGKRLNSPNDVVVRSDGSIWFTDPPYGIESDYEGYRSEPEIGGNYVYRVDPHSGACEIVADDFDRPNGLAFSPDERQLYIVDSGPSAEPRPIRVFDVSDDGKLSGGDIFVTATTGGFDGFRFDTDGRIWTSATDGVHCITPDGALIGKVYVPEKSANVVFGGPKRNRLFICATTSIYSVLLAVNGAKTF